MTFAILRPIRRFARDPRGVAAIEFAMLLPLMVTLYLGTVEVTQGVSIDRKVTLTTRTVADLVTQSASINNAAMTNILDSAAKILSPYPTVDLKVTVSAVTIAADKKATIAWSDTRNNGTVHAPGQQVTLPSDALAVPNTTLIWSEVSYLYKPTIGYVITGTINLSDQTYMRPRLSDTITRTVN
jgi:Flp pilus assembly protein TadG